MCLTQFRILARLLECFLLLQATQHFLGGRRLRIDFTPAQTRAWLLQFLIFRSILLHELSRTLGAGTGSAWTAGFHIQSVRQAQDIFLVHVQARLVLDFRFDRAIVHIEIGSVFHLAHVHKLSPRSQVVIFVRSDFVLLRRSGSPTSF